MNHFPNPREKRMKPGPSFSFVDIFAGIGGMRLGFESAGGECLFTCEWDKFAQQTYRANFGDEEIAGDIRKVSEYDVPAHDVLLAGFPCQPFSIAGVSKKNALKEPHGFACEAQGTLFFDLARLIAHHRPKAFLLENVRNLIGHDRGRTFKTICSILENELKYHISPRVIDAKPWVPQHRERIFIAGFRDAKDFDLKKMEVPEVSGGPKLQAILHSEDSSEEAEPHYTEGARAKVGDRYTLSEHLWDYLKAYAASIAQRGTVLAMGWWGAVTPPELCRRVTTRTGLKFSLLKKTICRGA